VRWTRTEEGVRRAWVAPPARRARRLATPARLTACRPARPPVRLFAILVGTCPRPWGCVGTRTRRCVRAALSRTLASSTSSQSINWTGGPGKLDAGSRAGTKASWAGARPLLGARPSIFRARCMGQQPELRRAGMLACARASTPAHARVRMRARTHGRARARTFECIQHPPRPCTTLSPSPAGAPLVYMLGRATCVEPT